MNVNALETFLAILETGSLVRAAEQLHVGQSTVTTRLQKLEEHLGQTLFTRQKSGVSLTASGYKFRRYAEAMTDLWRQARQETSLPEGIRSVCNLGCELDLWPVFGRRFMNKVHAEQPDTALSVMPGKPDELEQWLATGLVDAALTFRQMPHENLQMHALMTEALVLVSSRPNSSLRADPRYIYVDLGEEFGRRHTAAYSDAGVAKVSFSSASWALDFLLERGGSAYLPSSMVRQYCETGTLYHLAGAPAFSREVYLVTRQVVSDGWPWLDELLHWMKGVDASRGPDE